MNSRLIFNDVNTDRIQYIAILGSVLLFMGLLELIRKRKIKEEYSLLWIFFGIVFIVFSVWRGALEMLSYLTGIAYAPAALFLIFFMAIFGILVQFSMIISKLSETNKRLNQEMGIMKMELEDLQNKNVNPKQ